MNIDAANIERDCIDTSDYHLVSPQVPSHLRTAYTYCRDLTAQHSRSFSLAARLLPPDKRAATWALYAFCRTVDDAVDFSPMTATTTLNRWRQVVHGLTPPPDDPVAAAWSHTLHRFPIPKRYALELIDGVERDLVQTRYETFADLSTYCYSVASTVGLMSMHITGYCGTEATLYAVKLGIALQMTNILRDVGDDWARGRLYLPLDELAQFDLSERDIQRGQVTDDWRRFLDFQIARTRQLYRDAWPGIGMLDASGRFAIAAAARFYMGILDEIERNDYNVFSLRAHVPTWDKLRQLPGLWWKTRANPAQLH